MNCYFVIICLVSYLIWTPTSALTMNLNYNTSQSSETDKNHNYKDNLKIEIDKIIDEFVDSKKRKEEMRVVNLGKIIDLRRNNYKHATTNNISMKQETGFVSPIYLISTLRTRGLTMITVTDLSRLINKIKILTDLVTASTETTTSSVKTEKTSAVSESDTTKVSSEVTASEPTDITDADVFEPDITLPDAAEAIVELTTELIVPAAAKFRNQATLPSTKQIINLKGKIIHTQSTKNLQIPTKMLLTESITRPIQKSTTPKSMKMRSTSQPSKHAMNFKHSKTTEIPVNKQMTWWESLISHKN